MNAVRIRQGEAATETAGPAAEVASLDATAQAELVRRGEVTGAELAEWAIERIERLNPARTGAGRARSARRVFGLLAGPMLASCDGPGN